MYEDEAQQVEILGERQGQLPRQGIEEQDMGLRHRLNSIQDDIQVMHEMKSKQRNNFVEESEADDKSDRNFAEFQLNVLLSLRRKNLAILAEEIQKE